MAGGWYDQHPAFVDAIEIILSEKAAKHERDEARNRRTKQSKAQTKVPM